jgi:hypothetical protein
MDLVFFISQGSGRGPKHLGVEYAQFYTSKFSLQADPPLPVDLSNTTSTCTVVSAQVYQERELVLGRENFTAL